MIDAGDFFEHALVHGDWKGTAIKAVESRLAEGRDVLLEIDWQGARQVRKQVPDAVGVFILPPSREALDQRMRKRGQDSEAVMARRLAAAREETSHYDEFDSVIVHEHFDTAVDEMCTIFAASRLRPRVPAQRPARLLAPPLGGEQGTVALVAAAREEMSHYDEFDYVIVNEHFDTAVDEMCTIFAASRLRRRVQAQRHAELIETLLAGE